MKVTFDHSQDEAANIRTFFFRPEKPMHYTAGQYTQLHLPHVRPDDRGQKRWFTINWVPATARVGIDGSWVGANRYRSYS